jgi:RNA polymerase sigma-70 factor (ECF subfamily)
MMTTAQIQKLVQKAQGGDKEALQKLYNHFFNQVYYYIYSRINNLHEAQEITSNVFLSMIENINKFKGQSSFKNYIFGIAKNKIRDQIRYKYKTADFVQQSYFEDQAFDQIAEVEVDNSYKKKLRSALSYITEMLNPRYAKILDLRFNQMNSIEETAKILGVTGNNVKVLQHRAIKQAAKIWNNLNVEIKQKLLRKS